jgi:cytochrome c-type biogenesis protein CcmH
MTGPDPSAFLTPALVAPALLALAVLGWLVWPLLRQHRAAPDAAGKDLAVYRDQLAAIDRDVARGILAPAEAEGTRAEIARRLIAAADAAGTAAPPRPAPRAASLALAAALALALVAGGIALYARIGAPGYADLPLRARIAAAEDWRATRPGQAEAEAEIAAADPTAAPAPAANPEHLALIDQLRTVLQSRPDDLRGHRLLAENLARLGRFPDAYRAQSDVLRILGGKATAADHSDMAEYMILATRGFVSPEAEHSLRQALVLDPQEPRARYYSGLAMAQAGRPDLAYDLWARLLAEGPPDAPWITPIRLQLPDIAAAAGRGLPPDFTPFVPPAETAAPAPAGPAPAGPDDDAIADAAAMDPADRAAMIEGMVANLGQRLATEGGPPEDWARLITSLAVLGRRDEAATILAEARATFAGDAAAMGLIDEAATRLQP